MPPISFVLRQGNSAATELRNAWMPPLKPSVVPRALTAVRDAAAKAQPLWISLAAGVRLSALSAALSDDARIVRAMSNTPAQVRCGATAICGNERASSDDLALARALFESVGVCWQTADEALLDAVTGLSGSGPAYVFVFLEALTDAGVRVGLPRDAASQRAWLMVLALMIHNLPEGLAVGAAYAGPSGEDRSAAMAIPAVSAAPVKKKMSIVKSPSPRPSPRRGEGAESPSPRPSPRRGEGEMRDGAWP